VKARGLCSKHWKQDQRRSRPGFDTWIDIRCRCRNPDHPVYHRYGGRGILIDPKWETYDGFVADMGLRSPGHVIHRKDNDGNYTKANCVWMDRVAHMRYHAAVRHAISVARPERVCTMVGCERRVLAKGLCGRHYYQKRAHPALPTQEAAS
jgi:hypothetical protein